MNVSSDVYPSPMSAHTGGHWRMHSVQSFWARPNVVLLIHYNFSLSSMYVIVDSLVRHSLLPYIRESTLIDPSVLKFLPGNQRVTEIRVTVLASDGRSRIFPF